MKPDRKPLTGKVLQDLARGRRKDLCQDTLQRLWAGDMTIREIAAELEVTDTTIYRRAEEWGLPARADPEGRAERNRVRRGDERAARKAEKVARAAADKLLERVLSPEAPALPLTPDQRIRATGGAYAKLEALAAELGISVRQINYRWHQVRRAAVGIVNAKPYDRRAVRPRADARRKPS